MTEIYREVEAPSEPEGPVDRAVARFPRAVSSAQGQECGMRRETWLPAAPAGAQAARSIVREAAAEVGLNPEGTWDLTLAATEAFANAVQHGEAWPNGCLLLVTEPCRRGLRVEVCDLGTFESTLEPAPLEATSGRGMRMIATLVDRLEVKTQEGSTVVRFEKHRDPASLSTDREAEWQAASNNGNRAAAVQ